MITSCLHASKVDLVILCEMWLTNEVQNLISVPGYEFYGVDRTNKKGGGVGFLIAKELKYIPRQDLSIQDNSFENCFIEISSKGRNIICGSIYRPPNTNVKMFQNKMNECMDRIKLEKHKNIILGMDHNLDLIKSNTHSGTENFISSLLDKSLFPCMTRPTRITKNSATLIDNIIINEQIRENQKSCVILHDLSDHFPSLIIISELFAKKRAPKEITSRCITDCKLENLKRDLNLIDWNMIMVKNDVDESYSKFLKIVLDHVDSHIPLKKITILAKQLICKPWQSKGLLKCSKKQKLLYERALKSGNEDDHTKHKLYRSTLQRILHKCKKNYYISQCAKFKDDSKRLWKTINNVVKKTTDKTCIIDSIKVGNIVYNDSNIISNEFGRYFSTIGMSIATKDGNSSNSVDFYLNKIPWVKNSVFLTPCTSTEIKTLIATLPNKASSGYDNIDNRLLKEIGDCILKPLTTLFNMSLQFGLFPKDMKVSDITPLFKNGSRQMPTNYRPISLLPTISKLLEKIMYSRIYSFMDTNQLFFHSQYGFRKKHSCKHAITELIGEISKGLENKKHTIALFIDLSKAFDTISHDILYRKLDRYGIRGTALNWFKSYLENRILRAKCQCSSSSEVSLSMAYNINIGTPQGSCLEPLIFLIFCNDLYLNLELYKGILFADDTTIYNTHSNLDYLRWTVEHDLNILNDWFKANHLCMNSKKTVGMLFSHGKQSKVDCIISSDSIIQIVEETKFLGVWLDNKLRWKTHVDKLSQKVIRNQNLLRLGKSFLNIHAKRLIYFAQIQTHLNYCLSTWGNMLSNELLNKLQQLQNKSVQLINGKNPTNANYKSLGILCLKRSNKTGKLQIWLQTNQ